MQPYRAAHKFRHRMMLQVASESRDGAGSLVKTWTDLVAVMAAIEPLQGRALHDARQIQTDISNRVVIRYDSTIADLSPEDFRFTFRSKYYDVLYVTNTDERNRELVCMCKVTRNG